MTVLEGSGDGREVTIGRQDALGYTRALLAWARRGRAPLSHPQQAPQDAENAENAE